MRTLTKEEAKQRAGEHVKTAIASLPLEPSLTEQEGFTMECRDPSDEGPRGRYEIDRTYRLHEIPKGQESEIIDALYKYWLNNDYRVLDDDRPEDQFISVEHNKDAFGMSVEESHDGALTIYVASPCVWPEGVPPSTAEQ